MLRVLKHLDEFLEEFLGESTVNRECAQGPFAHQNQKCFSQNFSKSLVHIQRTDFNQEWLIMFFVSSSSSQYEETSLFPESQLYFEFWLQEFFNKAFVVLPPFLDQTNTIILFIIKKSKIDNLFETIFLSSYFLWSVL